LIRLGRFLLVLVAALGLGAAGIAISVFKHHSRLEETHFLNSWAFYKGANELNQFLTALSLWSRREAMVGADEVATRLDVLVHRAESCASATPEDSSPRIPNSTRS
jgi:hypothetical protein